MPEICDPRVALLVEEIRDLYLRSCALASHLRSLNEAEDRKLIEKCAAPPNPRIAELAHFKSIFDRQEALQAAHADPRVKRIAGAGQTAICLLVAVSCFVLVRQGASLYVVAAFAAALGGGLIFAHLHLWIRPRIHENLRRQLLARGVPICLACGYDLRGQTVPRCPECGAACEPSLVKQNQEAC